MPLPVPASAPLSAEHVFVRASEGGSRLRLDPMPAFRLRFRADLWEVVTVGLEAPALVPQLSCLWLQPGCQGVFGITDKRSAEDVAQLAARKSEDKGFRVLDPHAPIPLECLPPGVDPGGYLRAKPCIGQNKVAGVRHHEAFVTFESQFEGMAREVWHMGPRNRWLVWLVSQGVFGTPSAEVLARLGRHAEDAYTRALSVPWPQEIRADRIARAEAPLRALEDAADALEGGSGKKGAENPRRARRSKKGAEAAND